MAGVGAGRYKPRNWSMTEDLSLIFEHLVNKSDWCANCLSYGRFKVDHDLTQGLLS